MGPPTAKIEVKQGRLAMQSVLTLCPLPLVSQEEPWGAGLLDMQQTQAFPGGSGLPKQGLRISTKTTGSTTSGEGKATLLEFAEEPRRWRLGGSSLGCEALLLQERLDQEGNPEMNQTEGPSAP
jgi:hypothetical protein